MRTFLRGKITLLFMTCAVLLAIPAIVFADDLRNDLDNSFEADFEVLSLPAGGASDDVNIVLQTQGGDGDAGCNLDGTEKIEVQAVSSSTAASVKWADTGNDKVEFLGCNAPSSRNLTVTPGSSAGTANVTFKITGATATTTPGVFTVTSTGGGTYDVRTAQFKVDVTAPPNTPPDVSVTGVEHGATYDKGSVPAAGCSVSDAEDTGESTNPVTDSSALDSDGLGLETVTCEYTDGGGLTETASATYTIIDPSAPVIGYTLDPANADGSNGWYKSDVSLTWNVSDPQSPNSLQKTGCVDQTINADQQATNYTCSATSSGGSAPEQSVTIKRDATAPNVTLGGASGTSGTNSWYKSVVTQTFNATDATSGLVGPASFTKSSGANEEGSNVSISSGPVSDNAGNSNPGISAGPFKIDLSNPTNVAFVGGPAAGSSHYFGSVPNAPTCTADDAVSGIPANGCVVTGYSTAVGNHTMTATATDNAGRTATATRQYTVDPWTFKGFYQPIDMGTTLNTVKGGSTVPFKFELFAGSTELTDTAKVDQPLRALKVACDTGATLDDIELTATGGTSLRYDTTGGQYIYNWQTPKQPGACYNVTITANDGSFQTAHFKLK